MAVAKTVAHPKVVLTANGAPAAKQALQDAPAAPEMQTHDHHAGREQTADPKVALVTKMVLRMGRAWDAGLKEGLVVMMVRPVVDLVAPGCQVVNEAPTKGRDAGQALIADPKVVLATKIVLHVGREWDADLKEDLAATRDRHVVTSDAREWLLMIEMVVLRKTRVRVTIGVANTPAIGCLSTAEAAANSVLVTVPISDTALARILADQNTDITPDSAHETAGMVSMGLDPDIVLIWGITSVHTLAVQNIDIMPDSAHETVGMVIMGSDQDIVLSLGITLVHTLADLNTDIMPGLAHETVGMVIMGLDQDIVLNLGITLVHTLAALNTDIMPSLAHETAGMVIMGLDPDIVLSSAITLVHTLEVQNTGITRGSAHEMADTVITASVQDIGLSSAITSVHRLAVQNTDITPGLVHELVVMVIMASDQDIVLSLGITLVHRLAVQNTDIMPGSAHEMADTDIMGLDPDIGLSLGITLVHRPAVQNTDIMPGLVHETAVTAHMGSVQGTARHRVIISAPQTAIVGLTSDRRHGGRNRTVSTDHCRRAVA